MEENVNKHLILEILLKLPVRSLLRFKCVSKSWRSLICSSQFAKSHFDLAAAPSDRILSTKSNYPFDDLIDSKDLDDESVVSLRLPPPPPIFYTKLEFWGSCRGFVLLRYVDTSVKNSHLPFISDLIVWNPSTGEHKQVPHSGAKMKRVDSSCALGFGYDVSTDDYLVILKNYKCKYGSEYKAQFMLFSFKTNSWNYLRDPYNGKERYKKKFYSFEAGLLLNEALYWMASSSCVFVIVSFDLGKRRLSEIPLPPDTADAHNIELHTIGGCLGVSCRFSERSEIWVMKEYNMLSSWKRLFASSFCVNNGGFFKSNLIRPRPKEITNKTFESIFCAIRLEQFDGKICGNNYGCQRLKTCNQQGQCEHIACGGGLVLFGKFLWPTMYRESLLLLPNDSGKQAKNRSKQGKLCYSLSYPSFK